MGVKGVDLTGRTFGHLQVIEKVKVGQGKYKWLCKCDCGNTKLVRTYHLISGNTSSCGCQHFEACKTYGMAESRIYHIWCTMKARCSRETSSGYDKYGARGIKVCDEWESFAPFYEWAIANGYSDNLSIDRIDNDGNYEPSNCRWATAKEQANNTRNTVRYKLNGKLYSAYELSQMSGVPQKLINSRIRKGWAVKDAAYTPKGKFIGGPGLGHKPIAD